MATTSITDSLEFRRRMDNLTYRFEPVAARNGRAAWKRVDADVWIAWVPEKGWCVVAADGAPSGRPWGVELSEQTDSPPAGEWISKKGDKSYVYDLVRVSTE